MVCAAMGCEKNLWPGRHTKREGGGNGSRGEGGLSAIPTHPCLPSPQPPRMKHRTAGALLNRGQDCSSEALLRAPCRLNPPTYAGHPPSVMAGRGLTGYLWVSELPPR